MYLKDPTGNRRFWPVKVGKPDHKALARDRDQLWAEAAYWEEKDEPIELPEDLWQAAATEQEKRVEKDPWLEDLASQLGGRTGTIEKEAVWKYLGIPKERRNRTAGERLTEAMTSLGFVTVRPDRNGKRPYCFTNEGSDSPRKWLTLPSTAGRGHSG